MAFAWVRKAAVLGALLTAACTATANSDSYAIWYTPSQPSALVTRSTEAWFAYGENVNGKSGVGVVRGTTLQAVLENDPQLEVEQLAVDRNGKVFFGAKDDPDFVRTASVIGEVSDHRIQRRIRIDNAWVGGIGFGYDGGLYFVKDDKPAFGVLQRNGSTTYCRLGGGHYADRTAESDNRLVSDGNVVWIYWRSQEAVVLVKQRCQQRVFRYRIGNAKGMTVNQGNLWLLQSDGRVIMVTPQGFVSSYKPEIDGEASAIGTLKRSVCVVGSTQIACRVGRVWRFWKLPVQGSVSAFAASSSPSFAWFTYLRLDRPGGDVIGAIVRVDSKYFGDLL